VPACVGPPPAEAEIGIELAAAYSAGRPPPGDIGWPTAIQVISASGAR
jgi:hypothetical protein